MYNHITNYNQRVCPKCEGSGAMVLFSYRSSVDDIEREAIGMCDLCKGNGYIEDIYKTYETKEQTVILNGDKIDINSWK